MHDFYHLDDQQERTRAAREEADDAEAAEQRNVQKRVEEWTRQINSWINLNAA